jgi:hypothetical protein
VLTRSSKQESGRGARNFSAVDAGASELLRAREASLRAANLIGEIRRARRGPLLLKNLAANDDAAALLATAKAYEQTSDPTRALAAYRRLYFFAPASDEALKPPLRLLDLSRRCRRPALKKRLHAPIVCTRRRSLTTLSMPTAKRSADFPPLQQARASYVAV